jgi:enoyl-CoA hydratase
MSEPRVTLERDGHVLIMGINRPDKVNAFDLATIDELGAAYEQLGKDDDLRVGVLFHHGPHFSSGLQLDEVGPEVAKHGPGALSGGHATTRSGCGRRRCPSPS